MVLLKTKQRVSFHAVKSRMLSKEAAKRKGQREKKAKHIKRNMGAKSLKILKSGITPRDLQSENLMTNNLMDLTIKLSTL